MQDVSTEQIAADIVMNEGLDLNPTEYSDLLDTIESVQKSLARLSQGERWDKLINLSDEEWEIFKQNCPPELKQRLKSLVLPERPSCQICGKIMVQCVLDNNKAGWTCPFCNTSTGVLPAPPSEPSQAKPKGFCECPNPEDEDGAYCPLCGKLKGGNQPRDGGNKHENIQGIGKDSVSCEEGSGQVAAMGKDNSRSIRAQEDTQARPHPEQAGPTRVGDFVEHTIYLWREAEQDPKFAGVRFDVAKEILLNTYSPEERFGHRHWPTSQGYCFLCGKPWNDTTEHFQAAAASPAGAASQQEKGK